MRPLLILFSLVVSANAYGGIFGSKGPDQAVTDSGDAIVFAVHGNTVQLQVQLQYDRASQGDSFGWILPVPAVPAKLELGSSLLFHALFQETLPKFVLDIEDQPVAAMAARQGENTAMGETCPVEALVDQDCPVQAGPTRNGGGDATVLAQGHVGLASYKVLEGNKNAVMEWLQSNEWSSNSRLDTLLDYYDAYGSVYVVIQANGINNHASGSLQPILIEYESPAEVHKVPTLLSAAGPSTLQVYFLSSQPNVRAVPMNYLDVELDDAYVDWIGCHNAQGGADACYYQDYQKRYHDAVAPVVQQAVTTEYYGPVTVLQGKIGVGFLPRSLENSANWLEYLMKLEDGGVPAVPAVHAIVDRYLPPKAFHALVPFQCAKWEHVYQPFRTTKPSMEECFEIFNPPSDWTWDPVGLTQELQEQIFEPSQDAQDMVANMQSLTRLYGQLMDPSSTPEPHFLLESNLPLVSNLHRAKAVALCDLNSPSALEITLPIEGRTFWQPAIQSCPSGTWAKTSPYPILDPNNDTSGRIHSLASLLTAWGLSDRNPNNQPVVVSPNGQGTFSNDDVSAALAYGDASLAVLTDRPQGSFPGVPLAGTTWLDVVNGQGPFESNSYGVDSFESRSHSRRTVVVVGVTLMTTALALIGL